MSLSQRIAVRPGSPSRIHLCTEDEGRRRTIQQPARSRVLQQAEGRLLAERPHDEQHASCGRVSWREPPPAIARSMIGHGSSRCDPRRREGRCRREGSRYISCDRVHATGARWLSADRGREISVAIRVVQTAMRISKIVFLEWRVSPRASSHDPRRAVSASRFACRTSRPLLAVEILRNVDVAHVAMPGKSMFHMPERLRITSQMEGKSMPSSAIETAVHERQLHRAPRNMADVATGSRRRRG